jgi:hypothetical protein
MSERYWITGVQLGLLVALPDKKSRQAIADEIINTQFIGNFRTDKERKEFEKKVEKLCVQ